MPVRRQPSSGLRKATLCLSACLLQTSALAQSPAATVGQPLPPELVAIPVATSASNWPDVCGQGRWTLRGVAANPTRGDDVTFNAAWTPTLEQLAQCINDPGMRGACLDIQGQSDTIPFSKEVIAVFGSAQGAQMARARTRGLMVSSKLYELGVPAQALRVLPPSPTPTFRGVQIDLVTDCVSRTEDLPTWMSSPDALEQTLRERGTLATPSSQAATPAAAPPAADGTGAAVIAAPTAPDTAVWLGARTGLQLPLGGLFRTGTDAPAGTAYQAVATLGPAVELNAGVRFYRDFIAFAFFEYGWLGAGANPLWSGYGGGQQAQSTAALGLAGRWNLAQLRDLGVNIELGAGYRWLGLDFANGTAMSFGSPLELRLGTSLQYRLTPVVTLEALLLGSGGMYALRTVRYGNATPQDLGGESQLHASLVAALCAHFDVPLGN